MKDLLNEGGGGRDLNVVVLSLHFSACSAEYL